MILWPRKRNTRPLEPKRPIDPKLLELQTAKEILKEALRARPSDVDDMIQRRLEERSWQEEDGLWPREFCAGE